MRPPWREILIGWLAELADSESSVYISGAEAAFIRRAMGHRYPLQDQGVAVRLDQRLKRRGFMEYVAVTLRELDKAADAGREMHVNRDVALALVCAVCDPDVYLDAMEIIGNAADKQ